MASSKCPRRELRPSISLRHHHDANRHLLADEKSDLAAQIAYRGDHLQELKRAARSVNSLVRSHYGDFIHDVGRNLYPLILFTDMEVDGPCGVGSTLTLYRDDGSVTKVTPALKSNYELYKVCGHSLMGLAVEVGPYLGNASLRRGDVGNAVAEELGAGDVPWAANLSEYLKRVRVYRQTLARAVKAEAAAEAVEKLPIAQDQDAKEEKKGGEEGEGEPNSSFGLPKVELRETMLALLGSVIDFCESCLSTGLIDVQRWEQLNSENFPRLKKCMQAAVKAQADACVRQILEWREMMGPEEWRDLYVVIPTVWAVGAENPRKTMFRQLMDEDRIDSHIITTEYPRDHSEARTLLGRIVGDRSIGRFVFGDETKDQRTKTMGLSSEVDVVQDDALPAIWDAMERSGCPVRQNRSSMAPNDRKDMSDIMEMMAKFEGNGIRRNGRVSFC